MVRSDRRPPPGKAVGAVRAARRRRRRAALPRHAAERRGASAGRRGEQSAVARLRRAPRRGGPRSRRDDTRTTKKRGETGRNHCEAGVRTGRKLEAQHSREKRQETAMHISTLLWNIMTCGTFSRLFCCDLSSVERALDRRNSGINPSTVKHIAWLQAQP